jgi:hypothetical protein
MTEFGYYSPTHVNELDKARYSCRAAILLATRPTIKMANFFCLSGGGGFSYLNADGTPRPVYPAMANVFRWLSDCSAGTVEKLAPNLYSAAFKKGSATGIALWDTKSDSSVHIPVSTVKNARDIMGRNIQIVNSRISTSPSPVFLEFCDDSLLSCFSASPAEKLNGIAGESFSIGNLKNVIMPAKFVVDGSKIKADLNAEPGEYRILRKFKGLWQLVLIEISANR